LTGTFPNAKRLKAIGNGFSKMFPMFGKKKESEKVSEIKP